jgi:hypothetical protein
LSANKLPRLKLHKGHPEGSDMVQSFSSEDLNRRTVQRRAVKAAIWGMPLVSVDAMRQAYFRDAGAKYNDILSFLEALC